MKVLLVEDDTYTAGKIKGLLADCNHKVTFVQNVQDCLREDFKSFHAAIVDVMLPNDPELSGISQEETHGGHLSGVVLAKRMLRKNPGMRIILISQDHCNDPWIVEKRIPFVLKNDSKTVFQRQLRLSGLLEPLPPRAFIVHGHDETSLLQLKNYLQNTLKWQEPLILREQPNLGKTIIEKFESFAKEVDIVFVLLTPDDKVISSGTNMELRRARQNVIFELGFFYGFLKRESGRVIVLYKDRLEIPSDIQGIIWIDITNGVEAAGEHIRKEVDAIFKSREKL